MALDLEHIRSRPVFVIGALSFCLFTHTLLYGFLLPVLPSILVPRFSVSEHGVSQWIRILLTVEALATLLASPVVGFLAKILRSHRLLLLFGIVLLGVAMAIISIPRSIGALVAGRIVQGLSSALIQVTSITMILDCSPENAVGQSMGYAGAAMNLGFLAGPLLGGVLYRFLNWGGLFSVVGGVLALNLAVPLVIRSPQRRTDCHGAAQQTAVPAEDQSGAAATPFTRRNLLRRSMMRVDLLAVVVSGIFISAIDTVLPVFVGGQFHWGPLGQALIFLPVSIPALCEPVYGWLADKYGARMVGSVSFCALVPSTICLRLVTSNSVSSIVLLCVLLVCIGIFLDATEPAGYVLMDNVLEDLERDSGGKYDWKHVVAQSFGIQNAAHYFGITIGPILILPIPSRSGLAAIGLLLAGLSFGIALLWIWLVKGEDVSNSAENESEMVHSESHHGQTRETSP